MVSSPFERRPQCRRLRVFAPGRHIRLSDDAISASPTSVDLGCIHCHSSLTDLDLEAIFYVLNDSSDQWSGLLTEVFFCVREPGKLIGSGRHVLISNICSLRGLNGTKSAPVWSVVFYTMIE
jgi:hypothetical protein